MRSSAKARPVLLAVVALGLATGSMGASPLFGTFRVQVDRTLGQLAAAGDTACPDKTTQTGAAPFTWKTGRGWTSGHYPGILWMLGNVTGNQTLLQAAHTMTAGQAKNRNNTGTHDVGFMVYDSFGKGLE